jgi:DNA-binding transcriptional ArsR family regulator
MSPYEPRSLDDARTLRALAHPLRIELMDQLTFRGPLTATQCAAIVGESPSSCSFHLRTLAKYGFVEEAEGGTGRQRPWRVVAVGNRWNSGPETPPAERAAGETLARLVRERDRQLHEDYITRADEFEPEWTTAAVQSNFGSYLTPAELREIGDQLLAMWVPYLDRLQADPSERPAGARLVHMAAYGFPRADGLDENPASASTDADADAEDADQGDDDA